MLLAYRFKYGLAKCLGKYFSMVVNDQFFSCACRETPLIVKYFILAEVEDGPSSDMMSFELRDS